MCDFQDSFFIYQFRDFFFPWWPAKANTLDLDTQGFISNKLEAESQNFIVIHSSTWLQTSSLALSRKPEERPVGTCGFGISAPQLQQSCWDLCFQRASPQWQRGSRSLPHHGPLSLSGPLVSFALIILSGYTHCWYLKVRKGIGRCAAMHWTVSVDRVHQDVCICAQQVSVVKPSVLTFLPCQRQLRD